MAELHITCPLCSWKHEQPALDPRINESTLAGVFGPGIMLNVARNRRTEETERAFKEHLQTHTLAQWVGKVTALEHELALLKSLVAANG